MAERIETLAELREVVDEPHPAIADKGVDRIDDASGRFIGASPFFLLATTAADGTCDVSPRGDPPGSVLVLDDRTLAFADRTGNRRLDCLRNILESPRVGMLFMVPGSGDTVRVNGTATIVRGADYLPRLERGGVVPELSIEVRVEEMFLHCARAFTRSALWDTSTWPARGTVPTGGEIVRGQRAVEVPAATIDEALAAAAADPY